MPMATVRALLPYRKKTVELHEAGAGRRPRPDRAGGAALKEARERRDTTRAVAEAFEGIRHSFASGSLAHGTANCPIHQRDKGLDADTGVVLDRRSHPTLGPDSAEQDGPTPIVEAMRDHLRRELKRDYPQVKFRITKRAILISQH